MKKRDLQAMFGSVPDRFEQSVAAALDKTKEEKVMKRKIPVALVFALVIILALGVAFAIVSWRETARQIATMEAEQGYFDEWSGESRVALVRLLVDAGEMAPDARTERLLAGGMGEAETVALATEVITQWGEMREDVVTLMSILERVWGRYPDEWSVENLAWYTQTLVETGRIGHDEERFYLPGEGDLPREEAERVARQAILDETDFTAEDMRDWTVTYEFYAMPGDEEGPKWLVKYHIPREDGELDWPRYSVAVSSPEGEVVTDPLRGIDRPGQGDADRAAYEAAQNDPLVQAWRDWMDKEVAHQFYIAPVEKKAAFTRDMRPLILAAVEAGNPYVDEGMRAMAAHVYGVPGPEDVPEAEALALARQAVVDAFGLPAQTVAYFQPHIYYDMTDAGRPLWTFFFNIYNSDHYEDEAYTAAIRELPRGYRVELDACTGEVLLARAYEESQTDTYEDMLKWFI